VAEESFINSIIDTTSWQKQQNRGVNNTTDYRLLLEILAWLLYNQLMSIHYPDDPKVVTYDQAHELIRQARARGFVTVLAQGVFDIIHVGHTTSLKDAKRAGDLLFVGLEPDESARLNKGSARPFNPIEERLQLMADLYAVDYVFAFKEAFPYGPAASAFYNARLRYLNPDKIMLSIGDPLLDIRRENAVELGIQPAIVRGVWREYSTTKLLSAVNGTT
jgi:cytidyltransferase-like protein